MIYEDISNFGNQTKRKIGNRLNDGISAMIISFDLVVA
jgi:hypothetical protein